MSTARKRATASIICLSLFGQSAHSQMQSNKNIAQQESTSAPTGTLPSKNLHQRIRNIAEQEPTSAPTIDPTDEPTGYTYGAIDHQIDSASSAVSCKNRVLGDGTEITIDSETACDRACTLHIWALYWPSRDHDHFQYTSFEPVYHKDGSIDERWIDAVGECSCDYGNRPLTLCGPTEYRLQLPEKPLPLCGVIGVEYPSACSSKCSSLYPSDGNTNYDWWSEWSFSQGRYRDSCTCILNDAISVEICDGFGQKSNPNGSYNYNDEEQDITTIFPLLMILAVLGVGGCICVMKKSSNEQHQALSQYRQQQQQQRRQEASASTTNTGQPTEEELVARGDVVRSNFFSHTLSEDDDLKNLTSILIASSSNGVTNGEGESEATSSGDGAGLLETLRSAISTSTNRSSARSANKVECSICLMEYAAGETVSWAKEEGCDHAYHQQCIVGWLSTAKRDGTLHDSCPLCRTKLITEMNAAEA